MTTGPTSPLACHLDMTLREWIQRFQDEIVTRRLSYRGVPSWQNVLDLWVISEIVHETQPEAVVEIGCKHGGTSLWLADLMSTVSDGIVVGVDLHRPDVSTPTNLTFVEGDSISQGTVDDVAERCAGRRTMVIADGNHAADHVLQELRLYGPMIAPGCYYVVEDGIVDVMGWERFTPGPMVGVERFLQESHDFEVDLDREKMLLTYAPLGFLRKR